MTIGRTHLFVATWVTAFVALTAATVVRGGKHSTRDAAQPVGVEPLAESAAPAPPLAPPATTAPALAAPTITEPSSEAAPKDSIEQLNDALARDDVFHAREALEQIESEENAAALPALEKIALSAHTDLAGRVVMTVGKLAASATPSDRERAAEKLSDWLASARRDNTTEGRAQRSALVAALAPLHTPASDAALLATLDDQATPLHLQTLIVEQLAGVTSPAVSAAVRRFSARLSALPAESSDPTLLQQATAAAQTALATL